MDKDEKTISHDCLGLETLTHTNRVIMDHKGVYSNKV